MKLLALIVVSFVVLTFYGNNLLRYAERVSTLSFCSNPIEFRLGKVDPRFNIDSDTLIANTLKAADTWNLAYGNSLFTQKPDGGLTINLVYDERQRVAETVSASNAVIAVGEQQLEKKMAEFEARKEALLREIGDLNTEINEWNSKGGAPKETYKKLVDKQEELKEKADALNTLGQSLNQVAISYNQGVAELNSKIGFFNSLLTAKPEEGVYIPVENKINMYIYTNNGEFIHTLAHEFGHALGLDHAQDATSIMYPVTSNSLILSSEDLALLADFCKERNVVELVKNDLEQVARLIVTNLVQGPLAKFLPIQSL